MQTRREIIKSGLGLAGIIAAGKAPAALVRSLIAARSAMVGGGAKLSAKSYVQDGLIAMWDGIENAGWGVHDAAATTWQNLAQDKWHLNVASETTWLDKCLHSTNTQYYMAGLVGGENAISLSDSQTVEIVMSYKRNPNSYPRYNTCFFFVSNIQTGIGYRQIGESETSKILPFNHGSYTYKYIDSASYVDNTLMQLRAIYPSTEGNATSFTKDGVDGQSAWMTSNRETTAGLFIGGTNKSSLTHRGSMNGDVYCVRVYSRAPTDDEIAANYAVDKERFGLT